METEKLLASMKPVKEIFDDKLVADYLANENELQKKFDNRTGPQINGRPAIDYHVFSPAKEAGQKYPVLVWLHGMSGGRHFRAPVDSIVTSFAKPEMQTKFGGGAYIVVPRANEDFGMCATDGFLFSNSWLVGMNTEENEAIPMEKIRAVDNGRTQLPELTAALRQFIAEEAAFIDHDRVYLAGNSAGGYMTWQTLLAMPDVFAAAAPVCHAAFVPRDEFMPRFAHMPLWVICGELDSLYKTSVEPCVEKLRAKHPADKLRVTIFDKVRNPNRMPAESEHHAWVPVANDMFYADGIPYDINYPDGFIAWLMSHTK